MGSAWFLFVMILLMAAACLYFIRENAKLNKVQGDTETVRIAQE